MSCTGLRLVVVHHCYKQTKSPTEYTCLMNKLLYSLVLVQLLIIAQLSAQTNVPTGATAPGAPVVPLKRLPDTFYSTPANYVRTYIALKPIQDTAQVNLNALAGEVAIHTQYHDMYGRVLQSVARQATPGKNDLVAPVHYDEFGRNSVQYLPFAAQSGNYNDGQFKKNPYYQDSVFYKALFPNDKYNYSQFFFDGSPLNLLTKRTAPGASWTGMATGISTTQRTNTAADSVRLWTIAITGEDDAPATTTTYAPGTLMAMQTTDEQGAVTLKYLDEGGKTILTKSQAATTPSTGHAGWLCTYYVYDEMNQLRLVITPQAVETLNNATVNWNLAANPTINNNLCYAYYYDHRGRVVMKRIPGRGKTYRVYDIRDRLVFVQDPGLRSQAQPQWRALLYDAFNRPVIAGLLNYSGTRADLQATVTAQTAAAQGGSDGETTVVEGVNVNRNPLPPGAVFKYFSINYYDDYSWIAATGAPLSGNLVTTSINGANFITSYNTAPEYAQPVAASSRIRGTLTGNKKAVLNSSTVLYTVAIYDDHNRAVQVAQTNYTGGTDIATLQYSFSGRILRSHVQHQKQGNNVQSHTQLTKYVYDHAGRVLSVTKKLDNTAEKTISQYTYNELGQLQSKIIGANMETQHYSYNIRGWLTGINENYINTAGSTANYFGESLSYDYGFTNNQLNGAIAGAKWKAAGDGIARAYGFSYDKANRLKTADFSQQNQGSTVWANGTVDFSVSGLAYDANGNILSMKQRGLKLGSSATIDSLTYQYFTNSNQLQKVADGIADMSPMGDFKDTALSSDDYTYDVNGNITRDYNRHMHTTANTDGAVYNFLNKPDSIVIAGKGRINYYYDASGTQLRRQVKDDDGTVKDYLYINGFVYLNDTLQYVLQEEGRIRYAQKKNSMTGAVYYAFEYDYFIRDHLGNVRTVLTEGKDTAAYAATMESSDSAVVDALFSNVYTPVRTVHPKPMGFDTDNANQQVSRLNAISGVNKKTGPSLVLKVMAGDQVQISTYAFYNSPVQPPPGGVDLLSEIITVLGGGIVGSSGGKFAAGDATAVGNAISPNVLQFLNDRSYNDTKPKAYLNWILFDNQFKYVASSSGVKQVEPGSSKQALVAPLQTISKNGYLYIYVSNESQQDVYFDDLTVKHYTGPLVQEQSYYPFGLQMAGISDKALLKQVVPEKFNGGIELEEDYGLSYYNTFYRKYDPQIGRFSGVDILAEHTFGINPYQFGFNNPLQFNDPTGALTQAELDAVLNALFDSPYGGTWSADGGGSGSFNYSGGTIRLFGSMDQAFGYGVAYMTNNNLWGRGTGWATSFQNALQRYSNGGITTGMVEGYYMQRKEGSWFNVMADHSSNGKGFNVGYSTGPAINMYNIESHYVSTKQMMRLFSGPTLFSPTAELIDNANDIMGVGLDAAAIGMVQLERGAIRATAAAGNIDEVFRGIDAIKTAEGVSKVVGALGKASGIVDAGVAIYKAGTVINDPNATNMEKAGAVAKAVLKTALVVFRVNPVVGLVAGIADITGLTDWVFDW